MLDKLINKMIYARFSITRTEIDDMIFSDFEQMKDDILEFSRQGSKGNDLTDLVKQVKDR